MGFEAPGRQTHDVEMRGQRRSSLAAGARGQRARRARRIPSYGQYRELATARGASPRLDGHRRVKTGSLVLRVGHLKFFFVRRRDVKEIRD